MALAFANPPPMPSRMDAAVGAVTTRNAAVGVGATTPRATTATTSTTTTPEAAATTTPAIDQGVVASPTTLAAAPSSSSSRGRPCCQPCKKAIHEVMDCWHRFDEDYVPDARHVATAMREQGGDGVWYVDSGAMDHVTSELEQLALREKYHGNYQIHTASGGGMDI